MPIAVDPTSTWDYVLKDDRTIPDPQGSEPIKNPQPTVFELGVLDVGDAARLEDASSFVDATDKTLHSNSGSTELEVLRLGLKGCRDFFGRDGSLIEFETEPNGKGSKATRSVVTNRFLNRLSIKHRAELAEAIQLGNRLTEDEKKA